MAKKKRKKKAAPPEVRPPSRPKTAETAKPAKPKRPAQQKQQHRRGRSRLSVVLVVVLAILPIAGWIVIDRRQDAALRRALTSGTCETDSRSDPTQPAGRNHVPNPAYRVNPPAGGDHTPAVARSGEYAGRTVPPEGQLVHALEHGYVIFWHRPNIAPADLQRLKDIRNRQVDDVLLVERASLPVPVAATAWRRRLLCQQVEEPALTRFVEEYVGEGPEDVGRG